RLPSCERNAPFGRRPVSSTSCTSSCGIGEGCSRAGGEDAMGAGVGALDAIADALVMFFGSGGATEAIGPAAAGVVFGHATSSAMTAETIATITAPTRARTTRTSRG